MTNPNCSTSAKPAEEAIEKTEAPRFPAEFISNITTDLSTALSGWLRANGVPLEVTMLISNLETLSVYYGMARLGEVPFVYNDYVSENIESAVNGIINLGGRFQSDGLLTAPQSPKFHLEPVQ